MSRKPALIPEELYHVGTYRQLDRWARMGLLPSVVQGNNTQGRDFTNVTVREVQAAKVVAMLVGSTETNDLDAHDVRTLVKGETILVALDKSTWVDVSLNCEGLMRLAGQP